MIRTIANSVKTTPITVPNKLIRFWRGSDLDLSRLTNRYMPVPSRNMNKPIDNVIAPNTDKSVFINTILFYSNSSLTKQSVIPQISIGPTVVGKTYKTISPYCAVEINKIVSISSNGTNNLRIVFHLSF